jgi:hypothetical protein
MILKLIDNSGITYLDVFNVDIEGVEVVFGHETVVYTHKAKAVYFSHVEREDLKGKIKETIKETDVHSGKIVNIVGEDACYLVEADK